MLDSSARIVADQHIAVGMAARLDDAHSSQVDRSIRHDAAMTEIARKVLDTLDNYLSWESAPGASHLVKLMPEFRRTVMFGLLQPDRCPYDDAELERFEEAGEHGVRVVFQCPSMSHTWPSLPFEMTPDFSTFEDRR